MKEIAVRVRRRWGVLRQHGGSTCAADGACLVITYAGGSTHHRLNEDEALQYLAYLDGGGTGTHFVCKKEDERDSAE